MKKTIKRQIDEKKRKRIVIMAGKKYPNDYIAAYFNITEARVSQILKEEKVKHKKVGSKK